MKPQQPSFNRAARFARLVAKLGVQEYFQYDPTGFNRAARFARLVAPRFGKHEEPQPDCFNRAARFARLVALRDSRTGVSFLWRFQ